MRGVVCPPNKVLEPAKNSAKGDYAATAVPACLILMTEPDACAGAATNAKVRKPADTGPIGVPSINNKASKLKSDTPRNSLKQPR